MSVAFAVGLLNVILGIAYTSYGLITIYDMKRGWKTLGYSHFGFAWILMTFTCGPHHLIHGTHILAEGRLGGGLDLFAVIVGLPAGVAFLLLRYEAALGGRGDRFISGTPLWVQALPTVSAVYLTLLVVGIVTVAPYDRIPRQLFPNMLLIGLYFAIGYFVLRTQLRNRPRVHGWSVSGLALGFVFPTCGLMHGVYAAYAATGLYHLDWHGYAIDWLGVPAAAYFLWVVRGLYRQSFPDWNRRMMDSVPQRAAAAVVSV